MNVLRAGALPMIRCLAGLMVAASLPPAAQAAVYKCVEEGRVVFADRPCAYVHTAGPAAVQKPAQPAIPAGAAMPPPAELRPARR